MEGMCVKFDVIGLDSPCVDLAVNVRCFPKPNGAERIQNLSWQGGGKVASGMVAAARLAILRACNLFEESEFLADLTIRHPQNDNAELLWHCGPFPYSLKKDGVEAKLVDGQERFELKQGDLTVCRFDDVDGEYYLFAGEAKTTTGPETNGTYVWMETDNWKRWEEKLMFGPYIHHLGCVYGHYLPVLREVSRYLGIHFDNAHEQGIYSL